MVVYIEDLTPAPAEVTEDVFAAPPEINEQSCSNTVRALEAAKVHLDKSSKCLLKCYSSELESSNEQFIRVRSELTMLATVYKDLHLPLATKVVTDLREVIMLHADYDVKEFKKNIRDIEQSMAEQAVSAALLTKANVLLLLDLNHLHFDLGKEIVSIDADAAKKQKDASHALENGEKDKKRYDAKAHEMGTVKVAAEYAGAAGLVAGALGVGTVLVAGPVLVTAGAVTAVGGAVVGIGGLICRKFAQDMEEKATADGENAITEAERAAVKATQEAFECFKAVKLIKEEMIDSLTQFIEAMEQVSEFLSLLSSDTARYAEKVKDAKRQTDRMAHHLKLIKKYEKRIISACDLFVRFQVTVQTRCDSLPILNRADAIDYANKWCVKHEASGKLQQREHTDLQWLLNPPENSQFDSTFENKQGQVYRVVTWRGLRQILVKVLSLCKKRRATS